MKSLVAEDDSNNRKLLQVFLSRYGECAIAEDGVAAVDAVRRACESHQHFDLICMDLRMPGLDGQEAIREIRKIETTTGCGKSKVLVTTAHTDSQSIAGALLARCNGYLVKPIQTAKLKQELKNFGLIA